MSRYPGLNPETQAAFRELFSAIERRYGKIESFSMCQSFEDSPEFKRIAGIGETTGCEVVGCSSLSANLCCSCELAICQAHSHPVISDEGYDAFACPDCFYAGE